MLAILTCTLATLFLAVHLGTLAIAWRRCAPGAMKPNARPTPPITVVRPLCGIETFSVETLNAAFAMDYPAFELLFCVARDDDPIVPLVRDAIAAHPGVKAKLLIGDDKISGNPKLNNMVKGWREAAHDWIVFIDSNVLVPAKVLDGCIGSWRGDTGVISAPPAGIAPQGFGGMLECAFLNTYEARWQYAVDTFGQGFAQGKTLFYRKVDLDRSGLRELAAEPAEDAATTKMVRRMGLRVHLSPPSPVPIGYRTFAEVWSRQLRWARLRRATFLLEFLPEIASGSAIPAFCAGCAAAHFDWPIVPVLAAYLVTWFGAEIVMARGCRWPAGWRLALALVMRDLLLPALWVGALSGRSYTWKGNAMQMEQRPRRRPLVEPQALTPGDGV